MTKTNIAVAVKTPATQTDISGTVLTITFSNGEEVVVDSSLLCEGIIQQAIMHGLKQKLCDGAAISRNPVTGASATIQDKYEAVRDIALRIAGTDGSWNAVRASGEGSSGTGLLLRALVKMTGKTKVAIETFLASKTTAEKNALRKNPKVAEIIATLQTAKIDTSIDTDNLLAEIA